MSKAEVRIIQDQQEDIRQVEISEYEKEILLGKYGYLNSQQSTTPQSHPVVSDLSFEEMCRLKEENEKSELNKRYQNSAKPLSFNGDYQSETKYDTDSDLGFSYKITIVSNMDLPNQP